MYIELLAAASGAGEETVKNSFSLVQAVEEGGPIAWALYAVLLIMSVFTIYILVTKLLEQRRVLQQRSELNAFWRASNTSIKDGAAKLDKNGAWRQLAEDAMHAEGQVGKMTDSIEAHDWLHDSMQRSEDSINSSLARGLPFLATVGATAPFVGLLGTVIGILNALINIGLAGSASIDKVAAPVGEALIMTAFGLIVAVPAVLAYNWLQARNKRIAEGLKGFATDLLAFISSGGKVKPELAPAAGAARPATKPATGAKPATAGASPAAGAKPATGAAKPAPGAKK